MLPPVFPLRFGQVRICSNNCLSLLRSAENLPKRRRKFAQGLCPVAPKIVFCCRDNERSFKKKVFASKRISFTLDFHRSLKKISFHRNFKRLFIARSGLRPRTELLPNPKNSIKFALRDPKKVTAYSTN